MLERVCGICSHSHSTAFIQAVEELAGIPAPRRAQWIRVLVAELERLHSHMLWLGVAGHEVGFDTLFMYSWRDRELVMDLMAKIAGNRVNYGMNKFGGVRRDISDTDKAAILAVVQQLEISFAFYLDLAASERTLAARMLGVGTLNLQDSLDYGVQGPVARASGIDIDIRRDDPYAAYAEIPFEVITDDHCDVFGRTVVRIKEMQQSAAIIRYAIENLPDGPIAEKFPRKIPAGEVVSRYEAPRGEDVHYVQSNGSDKPERVKVRAPSLANNSAAALMMRESFLADVPIIVAANDPCFSCTDRMISVVDYSSGREGLMDWETLRRYSIDWYRNHGVDMNELSRRF
jgi:NADH-quinone oxidoreductase subunit D